VPQDDPDSPVQSNRTPAPPVTANHPSRSSVPRETSDF
jgi:hypothetical protein